MIDQIHLSWTEDPATSMTFCWHSNIPSGEPRVIIESEHGAAQQLVEGERRESPGDGYIFASTANGLKPSTDYTYRIVSDHDESRKLAFRTAPIEHGEPFKFAFFGDTGLIGRPDGNTTGTTAIYRELAAADILFSLGAGDYAYANRDGRFERVADAVDEWFNQSESVISRSPFFPQFGNHEIELEECFNDWGPRFSLPSGIDGGRCYSFRVAGAFFISLFAPGERIEPAHLEWLDQELTSSRRAQADWTVVYHHEAVYGHGNSHPSSLHVRNVLAPLYDRHGVDLVLNAHDQNYERTYPLTRIPHDPTVTNESDRVYSRGDGVIFAKISPSGKMSEIGNCFSRFPTERHAFVASRDDTRHHYGLVTVSDHTMRVEVFGIKDDSSPTELVDEFTITVVGQE